MKLKIIIILVLISNTLSYSQDNQYKMTAIGFYNLENLFDIENDTTINDEDFLPTGKNNWTLDKYQEKIGNMAFAISQIALDNLPSGVSVLGVSEIENKKVLEDLVSDPILASRNYQIVHHESPDKRGIDVALLYNPTHFTPQKITTHPLLFFKGSGEREFTRDILMIEGDFDGEKMTFLINHWPSRSGGEELTAYKRNRGAEKCREIIDSLYAIDANSKVFVMGDLNDDPTSPSIKNYLKAKNKISDTKENDVFNPMYDYYRRGLGSLAYKDSWSLFDQIIMTYPLLNENGNGYHFNKASIFNKKFLIQSSGQYKGYPFRTFSGNTYQGGYSDHFPVFVYLSKKI